jgi:hypothetical protein
MILWSLVGSLALAADPPVEAQEEAASSWWNRILSAWVQAEGLQSYQIQVELSFKENRRVEAVKIVQSSASAEQNERLVARLLAAAPAPKGTPTVAGFGGGAAVGGQDGIPKAPVVELTAQAPTETPANTPVNRDSEVFGAANTGSAPDEKTPEATNTEASRDSEVFGTANEPVNRDSEMFGTANEAVNRDSEMFGGGGSSTGGEAPSPSEGASPAGRDSEMLGSDTAATERSFMDAIQEAEKRLEIGGRLYLRFQSDWPEGSSWNSENISAPNLLDLYADYRPDEHVRAYADARLSYDYTVQPGETDLSGEEVQAASVNLDELWLKFDVKNRLFVTAGQQHLRWGTGRFWNPTDFLNPVPKDPLAVFDARTGVPLVKLHVPFERIGANVYGVVDMSAMKSIEDVGGAMRAEIAAGPGEYSVSVAARKGQPLRLGADLSMSLWFLDLKAEAAVLHGGDTPYWKGKFDLETFTFPTEKDRSEEWIPQVTVGIEVPIAYNAEDSITLGAEYFHNEAGYKNADLYPWVVFNGGYKALYFGRDYAAVYAALFGPGQWENTSFLVSGIGNLTDKTFVTRLDIRSQIRTWISWDFSVSYYFGEQGELHYTLEVPPVPGNELLENGLTVPASQLSYALGAQIRF